MIRECQGRPLEKIIAFVWMECIHDKAREEGEIVVKAVYMILGLNLKGIRDDIGIYISNSR